MGSRRPYSPRHRSKRQNGLLTQLTGLLSHNLADRVVLTEDHIQSILILRRAREEFFDRNLFSDPAWDIMLELYAARLGGRTVSIAELVASSFTPQSTLERWLAALEEHDVVIWSGNAPQLNDRSVSLCDDADSRMQSLIEHWASAFLSA